MEFLFRAPSTSLFFDWPNDGYAEKSVVAVKTKYHRKSFQLLLTQFRRETSIPRSSIFVPSPLFHLQVNNVLIDTTFDPSPVT